MKLINIIFLTAFCLFWSLLAQGQELTVKQLKKEKKSLSPVAFKAMLDEESDLKGEETKLKKKLKLIKEAKNKEIYELKRIKHNLDDTNKTLEGLNNQFVELSEKKEVVPSRKEVKELVDSEPLETDTGVYFRVQLGAFSVSRGATLSDDMINLCKTRDIDLSKRKIYINSCLDDYFTSNNRFKYEGSFSRDQNHKYKKYMVGYFPDYWDADTFKRLLREMGVHKAWIVPYVDGKRVTLKEIIDNHSQIIFGDKK